ncbi:ABC transporter ATP-binding protein [Mucilaginibacter psychrotolerans]|uniref:ATP-binding cassette domain-containing protein n=1 Tax=Mucilaginibacter psychrotolerans TaxID=1524096 RepID=A0A4Y8S4Q2_9SPHI|nr:ATP-binding cassette domain-containing protein [Mucilaginibacter psychrotolerans]TFF33641.1 ATP-binding cassette domain-containing protein [Mucilaginibacter psychrotolerans]
MEQPFLLETRSLSHRFADGAAVLNNINLQVPAGAVYGFLGANGAGKTTTLRLVLGLLKKQRGEILLFGRPLESNRLQALSRIGAMIESPSLYGHLTAAENLQVLQKVYRCPEARIAQVLEMVGLAATGNKKAARFSLGMKQRLSIAMALLHEPDLLILDEPTNGLDPNGMIEVRELLLHLNRQHGITIAISSHLLGEIEKMVSHVGIIHHGSLLFQGSLADLQQERAAGARMILKTSDRQKTMAIMQAQGMQATFSQDAFSLPMPGPEATALLIRQLVGQGVDVYELSPIKNDLEAIFMDMITN